MSTIVITTLSSGPLQSLNFNIMNAGLGIFLLGFLFLLTACQAPESGDLFFKNSKDLQESKVVERGIIPGAFVSILPPGTRQIRVYHPPQDTITYLNFQLEKPPKEFYDLIVKMKHAKIREVKSLKPLQPDGLEWWDKNHFEACMEKDLFIFRKLPVQESESTVYLTITKEGEAYAWITRAHAL